ncbi:MAG: PqqD family protein [Sulfuricurvum sp.]|jgi:hypothetical protein
MQKIQHLMLEEGTIAFHPMLGNSYQLNGTSKRILQLLKQHKTKEGIIQTLLLEYDVTYEELFIDVSDFFAKLKGYGLSE